MEKMKVIKVLLLTENLFAIDSFWERKKSLFSNGVTLDIEGPYPEDLDNKNGL